MRSSALLLALALSACAATPSAPEGTLLVQLPSGVDHLQDPSSCKGGCAYEPPGAEHHLPAGEYHQRIAELASQPIGEASIALETLLFFGPDTLAYLEAEGSGELSFDQEAFLRQELSRDDAIVEFRVVDDTGTLRAELDATTIPLREKQHLHLQATGTLGALEVAGKVKRVGLHHLWSRW